MTVLDYKTELKKSLSTGVVTVKVFVESESYESNTLISSDGQSFFAPVGSIGNVHEFNITLLRNNELLNVHLCCDVNTLYLI
jgi:hypothetical protein